MHNFVPHRKIVQSVTRSTVPSNPATSQCKLRSLDFDSVFKFTNDFVKECGKFLEEGQNIADIMLLPVLMQLQAFDRTANVTKGQMEILNERCNLPNNLMYRLIFMYSGLRSKQEFLINFVTNLRFATPPANYKVNPHNWQSIYESKNKLLACIRCYAKMMIFCIQSCLYRRR